MPAFDGDFFWKLAAWTIGTCLVAITTALALGVESSLLG
jgi:hypothetical protein